MKMDKAHKDSVSTTSYNTGKQGVNPFVKLMEDKERIAEAVNNNQPLSSLKDIKFVRPL